MRFFRNPNNPGFQGMLKLAPIVIWGIFLIVALVFLMNYIQERRNPSGENFDAVDAFVKSTGGHPGGRVRYNPYGRKWDPST
jgi:hypothetical protein